MKDFLLLSILAFSSLCFSQSTSIPDANFEQALINLGYDIGPVDGVIPTDSINIITTLDISWSSIADLEGIQDFTALQEIDCHMNSIDTLDFSSNLNLVKLLCSANYAIYLNVTQNTMLDWLDCGSNNFITIDLTQNILLTRLYCGFCQINTLDVSNNPLLIYLQCHFNQLTQINISQNPSIINFTCSSNQISTLDLTNNIWLQYIQCQNNLIQSLDFSNCIPLNYVECQQNQIDFLDFSSNANIEYIRCMNNTLRCLNLKNGNTSNILLLNTTGNSLLSCIQVDDSLWASNNFTLIDLTSQFSQNCYNNCLTSGINELGNSIFKILPNPATEWLFIETDCSCDKQLEIINLDGKVFSKNTLLSGENMIDIQNLSPGNYFIRIGQFAERFIKN